MSWTVYMHKSPSRKVYIGITGRKPEKRWGNGNGYKHCPRMAAAIEALRLEIVKEERDHGMEKY